MVAALAQGIITKSTKQKLNELEREKEDLEIKLLQEEMSVKILTREQILFWLHKFRNMDVSQRDVRVRLIDCFVNAVYVYDGGKFVVTLNFKDGAEAVKPTEVAETFGSTMTSLAPFSKPWTYVQGFNYVSLMNNFVFIFVPKMIFHFKNISLILLVFDILYKTKL